MPLMGSDGAETITPVELGSWSDTIGYEVLLAATERVRRVWLHEHEGVRKRRRCEKRFARGIPAKISETRKAQGSAP